jgi:hypothetical protein
VKKSNAFSSSTETFNSLSRDHRVVKKSNAFSSSTETFNSLSRDHVIFSGGLLFSFGFLSTPSLGITLERKALQAVLAILSTPSLGITEPDSGIFRLSAAFCRGAPSHK